MSKNTKTTKSVNPKPRRGRSIKHATLPSNVRKGSKVTVSDIFGANAEGDPKVAIQCRVTVYKRVKQMVKLGMLRKTKETRPTGGVGKPATVYEVLAVSPEAIKRIKATKVNGPKLTDIPAIDLTPESVPATDTVPDETVTA
jgi:hypothetical protein